MDVLRGYGFVVNHWVIHVSSQLEYIKDVPVIYEDIGSHRVQSFELPYMRFFAVHELTYLAIMLNEDGTERIAKKIEELKFGRKTIEKLYAYRYDNDQYGNPTPWPLAKLMLPIMTENEVEPHTVAAPEPVSYKMSIDVAGIKDFLQMTLLSFSSHKEFIIYRNVEPRGIVRYIINI